jgi:hypothetical protein
MRPVRIVDRTDGIITCDNDKYYKEKDIPDRPTKLTTIRNTSFKKTDDRDPVTPKHEQQSPTFWDKE